MALTLVRPDERDSDGVCWKPTSSGKFLVNSTYNISFPNKDTPSNNIQKKNLEVLDSPKDHNLFIRERSSNHYGKAKEGIFNQVILPLLP